jgi:hypothetical protein
MGKFVCRVVSTEGLLKRFASFEDLSYTWRGEALCCGSGRLRST